MKEVKEKQRMKAPKVKDPMRRMPRTAERAYRKVNEVIPAGEEPYDSPSDYAVQKTEEYSQETADRTYRGAKKTVQKAKDQVQDIRDRIREHRDDRQYQEMHEPGNMESRWETQREQGQAQTNPSQEYSQRPAPKTREAAPEHFAETHDGHAPESPA